MLAERRAVDAIRRHSLVRVGYGQDSRLQRNLLALQALRVAAAVRALVVSEDPAAEVAELRPREEAGGDLRGGAHLRPLVVVEWPGLVEDAVGDPDLADVVQDSGQADA